MNIDNQLAINAYNNIATNSITRSKSENDKLLKEQTDAFEAFLVKSVLDIALKDENPLFPKDAGDKIYSSMYNDTMSRALSGNLGFSELLFNFLKERT
ncbi:rod-binding protein [Campylobacter sp. RM16190]|uniref:rod-binding protein n=1 Tax=Campylobacter sp. RM16190 TaxID=1705727 RepID=UPI001476161D|nr:rod-binding protein [Campylobacter sp. RM16190]